MEPAHSDHSLFRNVLRKRGNNQLIIPDPNHTQGSFPVILSRSGSCNNHRLNPFRKEARQHIRQATPQQFIRQTSMISFSLAA